MNLFKQLQIVKQHVWVGVYERIFNEFCNRLNEPTWNDAWSNMWQPLHRRTSDIMKMKLKTYDFRNSQNGI
jgi:hypothetical protein